MQCCTEITRNGSFKYHGLASDRMMESQTKGMQAHATARVVLMAILAVTHHRVTNIGHVNTNLVLASREQMQEQQRAFRPLLNKFPLGC